MQIALNVNRQHKYGKKTVINLPDVVMCVNTALLVSNNHRDKYTKTQIRKKNKTKNDTAKRNFI